MAAPVQPPADDLGDPLGAPEVVVPAVGLGPLQQQPLELPELLGGQPGPWAGVRLGGQGLGRVLGRGQPAIQRGAADAEDASDDGGRLALLHELDGPATAAFQFFGGPYGSHPRTTLVTDEVFLWLRFSQ